MRLEITVTDLGGRDARSELGADEVAPVVADALAARSGYLELNISGRDFPLLTVGFQDSVAVVHGFRSEQHVALLLGDGTVAETADVEVQVLDAPASFTGRFAMTTEYAQTAVAHFVQHGALEALGEWHDL